MVNRLDTDRGVVLVSGRLTPEANLGLARIQEKYHLPVDILHDHSATDPMLASYEWVLALEKCPDSAAAVDRTAKLTADSWSIEVSGGQPARVAIQAGSDRAQLYALYHVADCLAAGKPPTEWAVRRRPLVPRRYAWPSAGNVWSPVFRPDQFERTIIELPGMGFNGVLLTCNSTHGTSVGRETIPFTLTADGVTVDRHKLPVFRTIFDRLKKYGLHIGLFHEAFTPPPFTPGMVREYYAGKRELPGFEAAVEKSSRELAEAIFIHLPQVDSLLHHSLECDWMWGTAVSIFPSADDAAAGSAFAAYLKGLSQACRTHDRELMYWTHVSGVSARQIRLQHRVLAQFPEVMIVEDHAWPNNVWPHAPVMGHLAEDLRAEVVKGRFGLSIDTTDGEYYGAGALPTAYPDPHIRAARKAVSLGAEMSFVRMNEQALTPLGTLDDINAIHVIGASEQWWESARPTEQLWQEWCTRRFGAAAAPAVRSALQKSDTFITKGVSAGRMPLIDHSGMTVYNWYPNIETNAWALFAHPGRLLVDKPYDELVGNEFRPWQVDARGVELEDFLRDSAAAGAAVRAALQEIDSVRDALTPEDATYLITCFEDALLMIEAARYTAVAARASALCLQQGGESHRKALTDACAAMEACADRIERERGSDFRILHFFLKATLNGEEYAGYGVPIGLRVIANNFRSIANTQE